MLRELLRIFRNVARPTPQNVAGKNEARSLTADQIRQCYEIVLGRAADEGGLHQYLTFARAQKIKDPHSIAKMFYRSDEFRNRFGSGELVDIYGKTQEVRFHGLTLRLPEDDDIARAIVTTGSYEPYLLNHLLQNVREGDTFVDVGANLGAVALPVAKRIGPKGRVLAFEPSQRNIVLLIRNSLANDLVNVEAFPIALSDRNGSVLSNVDLYTSNKSLQDEPLSKLSGGMEVVPVVRMDNFLDEAQKIDVMKIDVEGFEYRVIRGGINTIRRTKPKIYLEYSDAFQRSGSGVPGRQLLQQMIALGYGPTVLHRDREPESFLSLGQGAAEAVDKAWENCVAAGGTHLDLFWEPIAVR